MNDANAAFSHAELVGFFAAVRDRDLDALRACLDAMRVLLEHGADPDATARRGSASCGCDSPRRYLGRHERWQRHRVRTTLPRPDARPTVPSGVFGYIVVPGTLTGEETGRLLEAMQRLKADLLAAGEGAVVRGCRLSVNRPHHRHFAHILEADPAIYDYLTHPRLVGMAEELVGGEVRLEESEAVINERDPDDPPGPGERYGFHTGTRPDLGTYTENGLFHCTFIRSDRERVIVIGGYTPTMFQAWNGQEPSPAFVAAAPEEHRPLLSGSHRWNWKQRHRTLGMPHRSDRGHAEAGAGR